MVLDTCWKLATLTLKSKVDTEINNRGSNKLTHAVRPAILAKVLGLMLPSWANLTPPETFSKLSRHRNELLHEALYLGEPIGFAVSQEYYTLEQELSGFVACCIFGLLGIDNEYTRSSVQSRQIKGFGGFNVRSSWFNNVHVLQRWRYSNFLYIPAHQHKTEVQETVGWSETLGSAIALKYYALQYIYCEILARQAPASLHYPTNSAASKPYRWGVLCSVPIAGWRRSWCLKNIEYGFTGFNT